MPRPQALFRPLSLLTLMAACSSGGGDSAANEGARIDVAVVQPELGRYAADSRLGVVWGLVRGRASDDVLAIGDHFCIIGATELGRCELSPVEITSVDVTETADGHLSDMVISASLGAPSAARISPTGQMRWRYDGSYGHLGTIALADLPEGRSVLVSGSDSITVIDYDAGRERARHPRGRAMLSADWLGDTRREYIHSPNDTTYALIDNRDSVFATLHLPRTYTHEPVVTPTHRPFLVASSGGRVDVFDTTLTRVKTFEAGAIVDPMHIVAATFLGKGPDAPFAAVFGAPGRTAHTILAVFAKDGTLVYKEHLEEEHRVVLARPQTKGVGLLLGGRSVIWEYRFPTL